MAKKRYTVQWEVEVIAETPEEAALKARAIQLDLNPFRESLVFQVRTKNRKGVSVDLRGAGWNK